MGATPDLTDDDPRIADMAPAGVEAIEGFWLARPWLLADGCPAAPAPSAPADPARVGDDPGGTQAAPVTAPQAMQPSNYRIGVARFFTQADPRSARRGERAYQATKVLGEGQRPSSEGYNLVLSGRLRQVPGGRVIACRVTAVDRPPECVVSAEFDRVWIENPGGGEILAEWTS